MRTQCFLLGLTICARCAAAQADSVMLVDSHERVVGYSGGAKCMETADPAPIWVFSSAGFYACIATDTAAYMHIPPIGFADPLSALAYTTSDCTGDSYAYIGQTTSTFPGGFIFGIADTVIAVPPSETPSQVILVSSQKEGSSPCVFADGNEMALPAVTNDISISGFSSVPYAAPFHFEVHPDVAALDVIFFDVF
jgi:hypothetical protein